MLAFLYLFCLYCLALSDFITQCIFFSQALTIYLILSYTFWALETIKIGSTWSLPPRILCMISFFCPETFPELDFYHEGIFVWMCVYDRIKFHEA